MPQIFSTTDEKNIPSCNGEPMQILSFVQYGNLPENLEYVSYFENKASLTENKFVV